MELHEIFNNQRPGGDDARQQTASGAYGMAASAVKEATEVGEQVLQDGGNAFDAIIAIQFALAVVEGMNTGIGSSGFLTLYNSEQDETKVINGHSEAPAAVAPDLFLDQKGEVPPFMKRSIHPKAIGIPGMMRAMEATHERYGTMPLERLIDPAIRLAEEFRVNALWERAIEMAHFRLGKEAKKIFMPDGVPLVEGDIARQTDLVKTLKIIQDEGFGAVYAGEIADAIISTVQNQGGLMTKEDLKGYRASIDEPLWSSYKGVDLALPAPPNGGGFSVAQLLKLLEPLNISQYDSRSWKKYHLLSEVMHMTLADKEAHIGDPKFIDIPLEGLLHKDYVKERRQLINFEHHDGEIGHGNPWKYQTGEPNRLIRQDPAETGQETTHFTVADRWGNVAACTSSLERIFGSGIMVSGYGILLNNDLTDFNPVPGGANEPNGNKQPVSSKSPTIVFKDGKPFFTLGSPGGQTIVASVLQVLLNVLDFKMDLKQAIQEPRIYNNPEQAVQVEEGITEEARERLEEAGLKVEAAKRVDFRIGDVQAILINPADGKLYGAADSSRPGAANGLTDPPVS